MKKKRTIIASVPRRNLKINPYDIIGRPGGLARAKKLTPQRRKEIAQRAAAARWKK